ncbi:MAG: hypothetical protein QOJ09_1008, partial [Actinomycetota bacterium]|nr:hypothetical protein [Actinomycetota bacterium]
SHELRTPLNAVIGFADVLGERLYGPLNDRQAGYVEDIRSSGQHLLGLISEVLDVAKVESGAVDLDITSVDVADLLIGVVNLFRDQAARAGVRVELETTRAGTVAADERRLKQVVVNLVANAVALTPAGGSVVVGARGADDLVELSVRDTGPGVRPEDQERIFEAFEQARGEEGGGTGLGLPLARRLVEAHGGRLELDSRVGAGSTFTVTLSRRRPEGRGGRVVEPRAADGPPAPDEVMRQTTRVATMFCLGGAAIVLPAAAVLAVQHRQIEGFRASVTLIGAFGLVMGLLFGRWERALSVGNYVAMYLLYAGILGVAVYWAGAVASPVGAPAYLWAALAGFMVLPRRLAALLLTAVMASYGWILAAQPGNYLPVLRWWLTAGAAVGCAAAMSWLMGRLHGLTMAEHAARVAVEESWAELDQVSRHKSEFLANMSHELRTPLNAIIGFAEVLREELFGPLNQKQTEYVADVIDAGRQLLALINDILELAKAEAGRIELEVQSVSPVALLEEAIAGHRAEAVSRDLTLAVEVDPSLDAVHADPDRLGRVLANLVSNAVRFSPDGSRVEIAVERAGADVVIAVRDRGPGIAPSDQVRIFDEFQRVAPTGLARSGSGLGLALARTFAELHRGRLEVESDLGAGSTFRLTLPQPVRSPAGS